MFRYLLATSLILLGSACGDDFSGLDRSAGLTLGVTASSSSFSAGQSDTITITLTNTTPVAVTLHFNSGCQILPYIADSHDNVVLPSGGAWLCTGALTQRSLAPHEVQTERFVWTGSTKFASEMPLPTLPRGTYYISATLHASEARLATSRLPVTLN